MTAVLRTCIWNRIFENVHVSCEKFLMAVVAQKAHLKVRIWECSFAKLFMMANLNKCTFDLKIVVLKRFEWWRRQRISHLRLQVWKCQSEKFLVSPFLRKCTFEIARLIMLVWNVLDDVVVRNCKVEIAHLRMFNWNKKTTAVLQKRTFEIADLNMFIRQNVEWQWF